MWIEDNMDKNPSALGYSGSSGGALVAGALASGINSGRRVHKNIYVYTYMSVCGPRYNCMNMYMNTNM